MDELDFRILAILHQDPLISHRALATRLDTTATTIGNRVNGILESGVLAGFSGLPSASVLGLQERHWIFRPKESVLLEDLLAVDPVALVTIRHDFSASIFTYAQRDDAEPPAGLVKLLGPPDPSESHSPPRETDVLSRMDWRIMEVLCRNPRLPATQVAKECSLSPKTVRKRRDELVKRRHLVVVPRLDTEAASGITLFEIALKFTVPQSLPAITGLISEGIVLHRREDGRSAYLFASTKSATQAFAVQRRLENNESVDEVHLHFPRNRGVATERVEQWVQDAQSVWARSGKVTP